MCDFCSKFAADMRKILAIITLFALCVCAHAETIVLRTGARVKGTIVFQNEEVVIVRDGNGARFQYPRAEVEQIVADANAEEEEVVVAEESPRWAARKRRSFSNSPVARR